MSKRLLIVIATYNEADALPTLIDGLQEVLPNAQILVVDDNSPDGTAAGVTWKPREIRIFE